jgi:hypothetical protein
MMMTTTIIVVVRCCGRSSFDAIDLRRIVAMSPTQRGPCMKKKGEGGR